MVDNWDETIAILQEADLLLERWKSTTTFDKISVLRADLEKMNDLLATIDCSGVSGRKEMYFRQLQYSVQTALSESSKLASKKPAVRRAARPGQVAGRKLLYISESGASTYISLPVTRSTEPEPEPVPEPEPKSTRFLDLPAQLRIKIAQYAMTGNIPLKWMYKICTSDRRVGTFKHLEQLTALRRASKLLYQETSGLVWKCNKFEFDAQDLGIAYKFGRLKWRDGLRTPTPALQMFYEKAPVEVFRAIKTVCIKADVPPYSSTRGPTQLFRSLLIDISKLRPEIKLWVIDLSWTLEGVGAGRERPQASYWFFEKGCKHMAHQERENRIEGLRDWRIFPRLSQSDVEALKRNLSADQCEQVEDWMRNGV